MRKDIGRQQMKKVVLFGAGQVGAMVSNLMGPFYRVICFADNNENKWGEKILGIPVLSPAESLSLRPDLICLCVTGEDRIREMKDQLKTLGYEGEIISSEPFMLFDSRAAMLRLLAEQINANNTDGDCAELGVFRGDFAAIINAAFPSGKRHALHGADLYGVPGPCSFAGRALPCLRGNSVWKGSYTSCLQTGRA